MPNITSKTVHITRHGGPEVLQWVEREIVAPAFGEVLLRHHAVGLNFIDVYQRSGLYSLPLPLELGMEGAGVVEAVGDGVTHLQRGDRVAYACNPPGSYCERRVMPATHVCKLPDSISFDTAAAMMLKGLTVQYLLKQCLPVQGLQPGDHVLFHAAAGGVGLIACQWAKALGLRLIATAGSDEKCQLALEQGAAYAINYRREDFAVQVKKITQGQGVKVVYDSVGHDTWEGSLACLQRFGLMVSFGNASGHIPPVSLLTLSVQGLFVTRPSIFVYAHSREATQAMADDLFAMVTSGKVEIHIAQRYALEDVCAAHKALEARLTTGSTILTV